MSEEQETISDETVKNLGISIAEAIGEAGGDIGGRIAEALTETLHYRGEDRQSLNVVNGLIGVSQGLFAIAKAIDDFTDRLHTQTEKTKKPSSSKKAAR